MFADNSRSRIAREFFYTLNAMKDHYRALLRMEPDHPVSLGSMVILMAIYMLREEGKKYIRPLDIAENTMLPKSSVYRAMNDMAEAGILQKELGEFLCVTRTPDFLLNPTDLYNKPIDKVRDIDYESKEKLDEAMQQMELKTRQIISEEMARQAVTKPPQMAPQGYGGLQDMAQQAREMPMGPIAMRNQNVPPLGEANPFKKKKKGKKEKEEDFTDEKPEGIEDEMSDFFL